VVEADRIDDQSVALVMTDGFTVPRRGRVSGMLPVEIDMTDVRSALIKDRDLIGRLQKECRLEEIQDVRHAGGVAGGFRGRVALARHIVNTSLLDRRRHPWLEVGIAVIAYPGRGAGVAPPGIRAARAMGMGGIV